VVLYTDSSLRFNDTVVGHDLGTRWAPRDFVDDRIPKLMSVIVASGSTAFELGWIMIHPRDGARQGAVGFSR